MRIRRAEISDLAAIVQYNYNLAAENEDKILDKDILTQGVRGILQDERKGIYHVCEIDGKVVGDR